MYIYTMHIRALRCINKWETVKSKKRDKEQVQDGYEEKEKTKKTTRVHKQQTNILQNPYAKKSNNKNMIRNEATSDQSTLVSYLDTAKGKQRTKHKNQIRVTASFTPRTAGAGDYKRVIKELLDYARVFDPEVLMLPWDDNSGLGPIAPEDLANPKTMHDVIKYYFDKPPYSNWQPGVPIYGVIIIITH
jgi:hypothetical protein